MRLPRSTDLISVTRAGHTFKASRRTVAHLDYTFAAFAAQFPKARLTILQTCYHDGPLSAGTHDLDAVFDFGFTGEMYPTYQRHTVESDWLRLQRFLRNHGWGCWWRHTGTWAKSSAWHIHAFSLPVGLQRFATKVGEFVDGGQSTLGRVVASSQLEDYLTHHDGLTGHAPDNTWRPTPLRAFRYLPWVAAHGIPRNGSVR